MEFWLIDPPRGMVHQVEEEFVDVGSQLGKIPFHVADVCLELNKNPIYPVPSTDSSAYHS
jgi:hypothetical protein